MHNYAKFLYGIQAKEKGSNAFVTGIIISASPLCLTICSPLIGYFVRTLYGPRAYSGQYMFSCFVSSSLNWV